MVDRPRGTEKERVTNLTLVLTNFLLLREGCHRHTETTQPPVGERESHDAQQDDGAIKSFLLLCVCVSPCRAPARTAPFEGSVGGPIETTGSISGQQEFGY